MKTDMEKLYFAVLVPHRDVEAALKAQSRFLFSAGFPGAYSFPHVAPLALLSRPLSAAALRALGKAFRKETLKGGRDGRFSFDMPSLVLCPPRPSFPGFYGPSLDLNPRGLPWPEDKSLYVFPSLVLCTALTVPGVPAEEGRLAEAVKPSSFWFRAAALANLVVKPLAAPGVSRSYSLSWKLGLPCWLPSPRSILKGRI
jgi:hypothetical protein